MSADHKLIGPLAADSQIQHTRFNATQALGWLNTVSQWKHRDNCQTLILKAVSLYDKNAKLPLIIIVAP